MNQSEVESLLEQNELNKMNESSPLCFRFYLAGCNFYGCSAFESLIFKKKRISKRKTSNF